MFEQNSPRKLQGEVAPKQKKYPISIISSQTTVTAKRQLSNIFKINRENDSESLILYPKQSCQQDGKDVMLPPTEKKSRYRILYYLDIRHTWSDGESTERQGTLGKKKQRQAEISSIDQGRPQKLSNSKRICLVCFLTLQRSSQNNMNWIHKSQTNQREKNRRTQCNEERDENKK